MGTVVFAALLAGCGAGPGNPNQLAPKVLVHPWPDGNVTVYVHSAFGEHDYEWITVDVDNATVADANGTYSLEARVPSDGFFLAVRAGASEEVFEARARLDVGPSADKMRVAIVDGQGEWDDPRNVDAPFERILDRVVRTEADA